MNIFRKLLNKYTTKSVLLDGSYIESSTRMSVCYCEKGKSVDIIYELMPKTKNVYVYISDIEKWDPPYESELISMEKRDEIISKLIIYGKERGHNVVVRRPN